MTMLFKLWSLILLVSHAAAQIDLDAFPSTVNIGEEYTLKWTAAENYTYTIWLVADNDPDENDSAYGWTKFAGLATGLVFGSLEPSFTWNVPSNVTANGTYALWVNGFSIPFDGAGTAVVTDWFTATSRAVASSTSSSPSATSSAAAETSTASRSGDEADKNHHSGLSGGAIAGIVIGCMLAVALVAGAVFLLRRHRNRSTPESREAEARAARLAPVMEENFPGYELNTRRSRPA